MAWEWSHSQEAYDNARENLDNLDILDIYDIWAEIQTCYALNVDNEYPTQDTHSFDESIYEQFTSISYNIPDHILRDFIWDVMNDFRTCDNGGFNAWCCPYGCHTVPFDKV